MGRSSANVCFLHAFGRQKELVRQSFILDLGICDQTCWLRILSPALERPNKATIMNRNVHSGLKVSLKYIYILGAVPDTHMQKCWASLKHGSECKAY